MENQSLSGVVAVIERARGKTSVRKAAEAAGISEGRWRQIAKGYQSAAGMRIPVSTPPETLARMAAAVGVAEGELREIGAAEVAEALRSITSRTRGVGMTLNFHRYEAAFATLRDWLDSDLEDLHPPTSVLWLWTPLQLSLGLVEQVEVLERAFSEVDRERFRLLRGTRPPDDDQQQERDEHDHAAATTRAGASPADEPVIEPRAEIGPTGLETGPSEPSAPERSDQARPARTRRQTPGSK